MLDIGMMVRAGLNNPIASVDEFIQRTNDRLASPVRSLNKKLLSAVNPYAKKNILSAMMAVADPVISCDWIAVVNGPPGSSLDPVYIESIQCPEMSVNVDSTVLNGRPYHTAGSRSVGTVSMSIFNDSDAVGSSWVYNWWRQVDRTDRFYSLPVEYLRDITVFILDPARATVYDLTFANVFPTTVQGLNLDEGGQMVPLQLTLSCDEVLISADSDLSSIANALGSLIPEIPLVRGASSYGG